MASGDGLTARQASPHRFNGRMYLGGTVGRLGINDPFTEVFSDPLDAYERIVDHAEGEPEGGEPEWPDTFDGDVWAWKDDNGTAYVISEWVPSGGLDA